MDDQNQRRRSVYSQKSVEVFTVPVVAFVDSSVIRNFCKHRFPMCCDNARITASSRLCDEMIQYYIDLFSDVKRLFRDIDNDHFKIDISLIGVEIIIESHNHTSFFQYIEIENERKSMLKIREAVIYALTMVSGHELFKRSAAAIVFVGSDLVDHNLEPATGYASVGAVCTPLRAALVSDDAINTFYYLAHELGHLLGAPHDGLYTDCGSERPKLMTATGRPQPSQAFSFSCCSLKFMLSTLREAKCVSSEIPVGVKDFSNVSLPPLASRVTLQEMCGVVAAGLPKGRFEITFVPCNQTRHEYINSLPFCVQPFLCTPEGFRLCTAVSVYPKPNGIDCGTNAWCQYGKCVPRNQTKGLWQDTEQRSCDVSITPQCLVDGGCPSQGDLADPVRVVYLAVGITSFIVGLALIVIPSLFRMRGKKTSSK